MVRVNRHYRRLPRRDAIYATVPLPAPPSPYEIAIKKLRITRDRYWAATDVYKKAKIEADDAESMPFLRVLRRHNAQQNLWQATQNYWAAETAYMDARNAAQDARNADQDARNADQEVTRSRPRKSPRRPTISVADRGSTPAPTRIGMRQWNDPVFTNRAKSLLSVRKVRGRLVHPDDEPEE